MSTRWVSKVGHVVWATQWVNKVGHVVWVTQWVNNPTLAQVMRSLRNTERVYNNKDAKKVSHRE